MSDGNGESQHRTDTAGSVGGLSNEAVRAALSGHFTGPWRRKGQSRA